MLSGTVDWQDGLAGREGRWLRPAVPNASNTAMCLEFALYTYSVLSVRGSAETNEWVVRRS